MAVIALLALASPASATVLLDESGLFSDQVEFFLPWAVGNPARRYRLTVTADPAVSAAAYIVDGFAEQAYTPEGDLADEIYDEVEQVIGLADGTDFQKRFNTLGFRDQGPYDCYEEWVCYSQSWEQLQGLVLYNEAGGEVRYRLKLVEGGIPEPGQWALMLAGFGLVGTALRKRAQPTGGNAFTRRLGATAR
jgi:hypothetical protein